LRILGIETCSGRGSVALVEDRRPIASLTHERENAHGESIQPLIARLLAEAGWAPTTLDRIAVGTGPGSFTGSRVGIALAQGISEGLERPLVGVGSLLAMALAAPRDRPEVRCPVLDARRGETFFGLYAPGGRELGAPSIAADAGALEEAALRATLQVLFLGAACPTFASERLIYRSPETDLPHARWTAEAAFDAEIPAHVVPTYLRQGVAAVPRLPPNPLSRP
jgi:tRNA threonylcarbamoyladenosine biosynthesis protein TsaB